MLPKHHATCGNSSPAPHAQRTDDQRAQDYDGREAGGVAGLQRYSLSNSIVPPWRMTAPEQRCETPTPVTK